MKEVRICKKKSFLIFLVLACMMGAVFGRVFATAEEGDKRILFISSYSYSWSSVPLQIEGLQSVLDDDIDLEYIFMDTKIIDDETSRDLFYQTLKYRLSKVVPYDIIITGDDAALQFALDYQEELFKGIPIVFEGIDDVERALEAGENPLVTGIAEQMDYGKNIEIAMKINPKATKIVGILDDTITGKGLQKQFYELEEKYPELEFGEINCSKLNHNEICDKLIHVSEDTILFFLIFTEDADGNRYTTHESVEMVTKYASVPVYRTVMVGIGDGLIGGNVVSHEEMGEMAGKMALDILNGIQPSEIAVVTESPTVYYFDEQVVNKFGIRKSVFPNETIFINETKTGRNHMDSEIPVSISLLFAIVFVILAAIVIEKWNYKIKMKRISRQLDLSYSRDTLTGIRSRMALLESLQQNITNKVSCAVILFDIDDFNKINDELGHSVGDILLQQVAERLKEMEDNKLKYYRLGGDEFVGIVRNTDKEVIGRYIRKIREISEKAFELDNKEYIIRFSIGIVVYPKDGKGVVELINNASVAAAQVKKFGKDGFCYYEDIGE